VIGGIASGDADIAAVVVLLEQGMVLALCNCPFTLPVPAAESCSVWGAGCDIVFLSEGFHTVLNSGAELR